MLVKLKKAVAAFVALTFAAAAMPVMSTPAQAGHRHHQYYYGTGYYYGPGYGRHGYYGHRHSYYRHHRHHRNRAVVAGIAGFALGTILGQATAHPRYYYRPQRRYYRTYYRPQPWTREWYAYCDAKYRSFDPRSGTFQPYHGRRRLCR